jgi:hypothetical protein
MQTVKAKKLLVALLVARNQQEKAPSGGIKWGIE